MTVRRNALKGVAALAGAGGLACTGALVLAAAAYRARRSKRLQDKVVLITGSSRGLGLALAEEFGRHGAKLILTARDPDELERARLLLLKKGAVRDAYNLFVVPADLRSLEEAERLVQLATGHFGRIDILVNNAGVITVGPIENQNAQDFRDVMDSNFFTGVHCALSVLPQMLARKDGAIVNITSIGGKVAVPHLAPYTASKFAAVGFSEAMNAELRCKGIRVTTVCPGLMRTGSHLNALFTGDMDREYRWFSLGASFPGISTAASSAARKIVRAVTSGASEIAITPQAIVAARLASVSPEVTTRLMQMMNALLPQPVSSRALMRPGSAVRDLELTPATALGSSAARRYNQLGDRGK